MRVFSLYLRVGHVEGEPGPVKEMLVAATVKILRPAGVIPIVVGHAKGMAVYLKRNYVVPTLPSRLFVFPVISTGSG
jgi:hypothetical protein